MNTSKGRMHPNMLLEKEKNIDLHAKHPSFITGRETLGSIGWGVGKFFPQAHGRMIDPAKDRHHIKVIDTEHTSSGRAGFLRLNGFFSSYVDKKLEINCDTFHAMNHLH